MANKIRIKRSAIGGMAGPDSLDSAELAYESGRSILYIGRDMQGAPPTQTVEAIGGSGAFVALNGAQNIEGAKTFTSNTASGASILIGTNATLDCQDNAVAENPNLLMSADDNKVIDEATEQIVGAGYVNKNFITKSIENEIIPSVKIFAKAPQIKTAPASAPAANDFAVWGYVSKQIKASTDGLKLNAASLVPDSTVKDARNVDVNNLNIVNLKHPRTPDKAAPITNFNTDAATRAYVDGAASAPRLTNQDMNGKQITNLTVGGNSSAVTKEYVDNRIKGLRVFPSCDLATAQPIEDWNDQNPEPPTRLVGDSDVEREIDGVKLKVGDIILFKDQTDKDAEKGFSKVNGIYFVPDDVGDKPQPFQRIDRLKVGEDASLVFTFIDRGESNADHGFVCTNNQGEAVVGTNLLSFNKFSDAQGGTPITAGEGISINAGEISAKIQGPLTLVADSGTGTIGIDSALIGPFLTGSAAGDKNDPPQVNGPSITFNDTYSNLTIDLGEYKTST